MWRRVIGCVVTDVSKDVNAFILVDQRDWPFKLKPLYSFETSMATQRHIPEELEI